MSEVKELSDYVRMDFGQFPPTDRDTLNRASKMLLDQESTITTLQREVESLRGERDHCREWYGVRLERLSQFIRDEIPEPQKTRYFSIIANGIADTMENPTYAQQLNRKEWKVQQSHAALKKAKVALEQWDNKFTHGPTKEALQAIKECGVE